MICVGIDIAIQDIMDELHSPITAIPALGFGWGAIILAEVGDFARFDSPDKVLAYAGLAPSTYQSGQLTNGFAHMEKRGSRYLRYAIYNATKYVCHWEPTFAAYLAKKCAESKHALQCCALSCCQEALCHRKIIVPPPDFVSI